MQVQSLARRFALQVIINNPIDLTPFRQPCPSHERKPLIERKARCRRILEIGQSGRTHRLQCQLCALSADMSSNCSSNDELYFVMDCAGGETGADISANSISSRGGQICTIVPGIEYSREKDIRRALLLAYKGLGKSWDFFGPHPATVEDYEFGRMWWRQSALMLAAGKIKVHPPSVREGLAGSIDGLDEMRKGVVSATKLVYKI